MRRAALPTLLLLLLACAARAQSPPPRDVYCNPLDVLIADPFVLRHQETYYLYGTLRARDGFDVWTSVDLVHWRARGPVYERAEGQWPRTMFWAPEVFEHRGKFYLHGSAIGPAPDGHRIFLSASDTPLGPFRLVKAPWLDPGKSVIDGDVFRDEDGKLYLYYVLTAENNGGHSDIFVRRVNDDLVSFDGEPVFCTRPEQPWEGTVVNEGPFVLKRGETYFLMYSGNGATDKWYAVGYATAVSPMGPWKKFSGNPILRRTEKVSGPGHHSVIASPDGKELFIVYHTHQQPSQPSWYRQLAIDRLEIFDGPNGAQMRVKGPTATPQPMPSGSPPHLRGRSDEFDGDSLNRELWTIFNERPESWRVQNGWLTIRAGDGEIREQRADLKNLLLQPLPGGEIELTTRIRFQPEEDFEQAFLCLWQDHNNYVRLSIVHSGSKKLEIAQESDGKYSSHLFPDDPGEDVQLRIVRRGDALSFLASRDGRDWKALMDNLRLPLLDPYAGLGASSPGSKREIDTQFDFLHITPFSPPP